MAPDAEIDSAALRARRPAARQCAALGDGHSPWGRYRDDDFYISSAKYGSRANYFAAHPRSRVGFVVMEDAHLEQGEPA